MGTPVKLRKKAAMCYDEVNWYDGESDIMPLRDEVLGAMEHLELEEEDEASAQTLSMGRTMMHFMQPSTWASWKARRKSTE